MFERFAKIDLYKPLEFGASTVTANAHRNKIVGANASLLDGQLSTVFPCAILIYIVLQIGVGLDAAYDGDKSVCHDDTTIHDWVHITTAGAASCMVLTVVLQLVRITGLLQSKKKMRNYSLIKMHTALLLIIFVSGSSMVLTFGWDYGGLCKDSLGVFSPAAQWAEWLILVPLLHYVALASEQKSQLDLFDVSQIVLLAIMILFGYFLNLPLPVGVAVFFLLISVFCLVTVTVMTGMNYYRVKGLVKAVKLRTSNYFGMKMKLRKAKLLVQMIIILWYYPFIYLLALCQLLDPDYTIACYMVGSMFGKVIFASLVIESQVTLLYEFLVSTSGMVNLGHMENGENALDIAQSLSQSDSGKVSLSLYVNNRDYPTGREEQIERNSDRSLRSGSTLPPSKRIAPDVAPSNNAHPTKASEEKGDNSTATGGESAVTATATTTDTAAATADTAVDAGEDVAVSQFSNNGNIDNNDPTDTAAGGEICDLPV